MTSYPLFKSTFNLRKFRVVKFAGIIKMATMFFKKTFKNSNKFKRLKNYVKIMQSNFIEITFRHRCSPVNLLCIFRTPFPKSKSERLLLKGSF